MTHFFLENNLQLLFKHHVNRSEQEVQRIRWGNMKSGWSAVCSMKGPVDALNYLMNILKLTSSSSCDITIIWKFGKYSFKSLTSEHNISIIYIMLYFRDNVPERGEVAEQSEKKNRGWTRAWERKRFCRSVSHLTNGAVKRLAWECAETHNNNPAQRRQGNQGSSWREL